VSAALENLTRFDLTPAEARNVQSEIRRLVIRENRFGTIRTVAAADIALDSDNGYAAVIVYSFPKLEEMERAWSVGKLRFPYIPGLLAFRELPLLLHTFSKLRTKPDLVLADGHGWAHPRRAGLACHLGLVLDTPVVGCAKSVLVGEYKMPGVRRGSTSLLTEDGEQIGVVLRTRDHVRPVFVSCGHRMALPTAVQFTLACSDGYRIPKPLREADRWVKQLKR
jgi:deoxyribonuclease V